MGFVVARLPGIPSPMRPCASFVLRRQMTSRSRRRARRCPSPATAVAVKSALRWASLSALRPQLRGAESAADVELHNSSHCPPPSLHCLCSSRSDLNGARPAYRKLTLASSYFLAVVTPPSPPSHGYARLCLHFSLYTVLSSFPLDKFAFGYLCPVLLIHTHRPSPTLTGSSTSRPPTCWAR